MTAEQLEALAGGANPASMGMGMDYEEVITELARRVVAADRLQIASSSFLASMAMTSSNWSLEAWCNVSAPVSDALTAYREASK